VGSKAPALLESGSFPSSRDVGKEPYAEQKSVSLRYGERSLDKMILIPMIDLFFFNDLIKPYINNQKMKK